VGVDPSTTHRKWAARHGLRMPFINDADYGVSAAFGVAGRMGAINNTTFLIDFDGSLRKIYPIVKAKGHAAIVLQHCRTIWGERRQ